MAGIEIKLKPFQVPNYAIVEEKPRARQEGFKEGRKFHLSELDQNTLEEMCNEFRKSVFEKWEEGRSV